MPASCGRWAGVGNRRTGRGRDDADATYRVSHETLLSMPQWMERAGGAEYCGFRRKPSFYMASRRGDAGALRDEAEARKELGLSCELMDSRDIEEAFGFKAPLGLWTPEAAECDPYRLTHGLLKYSAGKGARKVNQDRIAYTYGRDTLLLVVADGMGGHAGGEIAAQIAVRLFIERFQQEAKPVLKNPLKFLQDTMVRAHTALGSYANQFSMLETPRTTCVVVVVQAGHAYWAHVGDSRFYLFRQGALIGSTAFRCVAPPQPG